MIIWRGTKYYGPGTHKVGGGGTGIRTLESLATLHRFQRCALDHYAIPPLVHADWRSVALIAGSFAGRRSRRALLHFRVYTPTACPALRWAQPILSQTNCFHKKTHGLQKA